MPLIPVYLPGKPRGAGVQLPVHERVQRAVAEQMARARIRERDEEEALILMLIAAEESC